MCIRPYSVIILSPGEQQKNKIFLKRTYNTCIFTTLIPQPNISHNTQKPEEELKQFPPSLPVVSRSRLPFKTSVP
ncbi:hypothetical protein M422DRAFT_29328 [Sphaerobolus stellatus SS14]|nr:hypothetical protein M422DRAFT_29328 [Sphaerobolus stellatus SS14]